MLDEMLTLGNDQINYGSKIWSPTHVSNSRAYVRVVRHPHFRNWIEFIARKLCDHSKKQKHNPKTLGFFHRPFRIRLWSVLWPQQLKQPIPLTPSLPMTSFWRNVVTTYRISINNSDTYCVFWVGKKWTQIPSCRLEKASGKRLESTANTKAWVLEWTSGSALG